MRRSVWERGAAWGGAALVGALVAIFALASLGLTGPQAGPPPTWVGDLYREAAPGVVRIEASDQERRGSGFLAGDDGLIVTNGHVVGDAEAVLVSVPGASDREGRVVYRHPEEDLAFVRVDDTSDLRALALADGGAVRVGDPVVAIGAPFGLQRSVSAGIVSGLAREVPGKGTPSISRAIQTDAALNPGNSGGPLVGPDGAVVGVATSIATRSGADEGVGFAIPASTVERAIDEAQGVPAERGYLGIVTVKVNADVAGAEGLPPGTDGLLVARILGSGHALRDGLRLQDVIVAVEGEGVDDNRSLGDALSRHAPGERVELTVLRGGREHTLRVALSERPPEA